MRPSRTPSDDRPAGPADRARAEAALRESELRYRTLSDSIDAGFCVIEVLFDAGGEAVDYRFVEANAAFEDQTGLIDAVGKRMREMRPDHEAYWFQIYGDVSTTGRPARFSQEARALGRWYDVYAFPFGGTGSPRVAILFNDVTEQRRSEEALREAAARDAYRVALTDTLRSLDDAVSIQEEAASLLGRYLGANRVHYAEVEGDGDEVVVHRDYCDGVFGVAGRHRVSAYGATLLAEAVAGRTFVVDDAAASPLLTPDEKATLESILTAAYVAVPYVRAGRLIALLAVHQAEPRVWTLDEVSLVEETAERTWAAVERARAEAALRALNETLEARVAERTAALRQSEERFRLLFASSPIGIVMSDLTGHLVEANPAFHALLGYVPGTLGGASIDALTHPDDREEGLALYRALLEGEVEGVQVEKRYVGVDGRTPWAQVTASVVRDEAGAPRFILATIQDVTERRELAHAVEAAGDAERRRLSYELHDDVAQRLAGASMLAYTLETTLRATAHEGAEAAERLGALVRDTMGQVRSLSRGLAPVDLLAEGLQEALERLCRSTEGAYGVRCRLAVRPGALVRDPAVATHLFRIAQEAVSNAARHAGARELTIRLARRDGDVRLVVADDGQGLPAGARATGVGGMGLRTMRSRAAALGGTLTVESAPGTGTTVTCVVPLASRLAHDLPDPL
ncbi:MAG TPA: PAS domain S-box protein, partial [Rhodothermales bacterium]|nr:PAS domain S-box protein [Rhodothermales bacterium]